MAEVAISDFDEARAQAQENLKKLKPFLSASDKLQGALDNRCNIKRINTYLRGDGPYLNFNMELAAYFQKVVEKKKKALGTIK